jgi:hypothetical protein
MPIVRYVTWMGVLLLMVRRRRGEGLGKAGTCQARVQGGDRQCV